MDPGLNEPSKSQATRRVVLKKPHRTQRDPGVQALVWERRRRSFGTTALAWLVMAVAGALTGLGTLFVGLAVAACLLSAAVVVKAHVLIQRATQTSASDTGMSSR